MLLRGILFFMSCSVGCAFAQDTELKLYRPYGEAINQPTVAISEQLQGQCFEQSQRIKRKDAWRCIVVNKIYDPCFVDPYASHRQAICPVSPWGATSIRIVVSSSLNNRQHLALDMSRTYPWALELVTGEKCEAIDNGRVFDKMPVRYLCDNQSVLVGYLARCNNQWSILQKTTEGVSTAWVKKAWF